MSDHLQNPSSSILFDEMVSEFAVLVRQGKSPNIDEFANRHEELSSRVRRLFPVLELMEKNGQSCDWSDADLLKAEQDLQKAQGCKWQAPERLGDFRLVRQIGRGGMGIVYEAEQESLGRRVAIKVLPESAHFDERRVERFATEAKASAMLHHTNIVPVFGIGRENGLSFFVMQFINGQPLSHVLKDIARIRDFSTKRLGHEASSTISNGPIVRSMFGDATTVANQLSEDSRPSGASVNSRENIDSENNDLSSGVRSLTGSSSESGSLLVASGTDSSAAKVRNYFRNVARVCIKVAEALEHAHGYGLLHRDIKPSNLLLDEQGAVWVTDFGLAKSFDSPDITRTGEVVGTLRYMAPEQLEGKATCGSDIFGLGLTLYEMLTLQPAYPGTDRKRLLEKVTQANLASPRTIDSRIPRDLETIVMKCVQSEPSKRYSTATAVAEDLTRFLEGQPILARRINVIEKAWKWCCRRPTLAASFAALAVSILLGLAGVGWQWNKTMKALEESKAATVKAEKHYHQARGAVVQLAEAINDEELLSTPDLQPVRGKLLRKALNYQIEFAAAHPDDIEVQLELAFAYKELAVVASELGKNDEAISMLEDAAATLEPLVNAKLSPRDKARVRYARAELQTGRSCLFRRQDPAARDLLFEAKSILLDGRDVKELSGKELINLAKIYKRLGVSAEANGLGGPYALSPNKSESPLAYYTKAMELLELPAADEQPKAKANAAALLHRDLGVANRLNGKNKVALKHYRESVAQFRRLLKSEPNNTNLRFGLGDALSSMGFYYGFAMKERTVALSYFNEAINEYRSLSEEYPSVLRFTEAESRAALNCGMLLEDERRYDEAREFRQLALRLSQRALLFASESPKYISKYGKAMMGMGVNSSLSGNNEAALDYFQKAREQQELAIKKAPRLPVLKYYRVQAILQAAQTHREIGDYAKSLEICREAVSMDPDPEAFYLAGRELLRLAYEVRVTISDADPSELEIADEAMKQGKKLFSRIANPRFNVRGRILQDGSFKKFVAADMGEEFLVWLKQESQKVADAGQSVTR